MGVRAFESPRKYRSNEVGIDKEALQTDCRQQVKTGRSWIAIQTRILLELMLLATLFSCWVGSLCQGRCPCCSLLVFQMFLFLLVCFILIDSELSKKNRWCPLLCVCGCNNLISRITQTLMVDGCICHLTPYNFLIR